MTARTNRRDDLLDLLENSPQGVTVYDMMRHLACTHCLANRAIYDLRLWLGDFDSITLVCTPNGKNQPWLYELTGYWDEVQPWVVYRIGDVETRLSTIHAATESIITATKGRGASTKAGQKVRLINMYVRRLREDLEILDGHLGA